MHIQGYIEWEWSLCRTALRDSADRTRLTLLKTRSCDIVGADNVNVLLSASWVWCVMLAPSFIILIRAKNDAGTDSHWHPGWNVPSKTNLLLHISLRTTCTTLINFIASVLCSQVFLMAGLIAPLNAKNLSLNSECFVSSGNTDISLIFNLVVWIRLPTFTPSCFSWSLLVMVRIFAFANANIRMFFHYLHSHSHVRIIKTNICIRIREY